MQTSILVFHINFSILTRSKKHGHPCSYFFTYVVFNAYYLRSTIGCWALRGGGGEEVKKEDLATKSHRSLQQKVLKYFYLN